MKKSQKKEITSTKHQKKTTGWKQINAGIRLANAKTDTENLKGKNLKSLQQQKTGGQIVSVQWSFTIQKRGSGAAAAPCEREKQKMSGKTEGISTLSSITKL